MTDCVLFSKEDYDSRVVSAYPSEIQFIDRG